MPAQAKRAKTPRRARASGYVFDPSLRFWSRPGYEGIAYSDGADSERSLLEFLRSVKDVGTLSSELAAGIHDWPTEAHLSAARSNLLRHFRFRDSHRILEIGAGCGALTRFLGETGARVDALEGAPLRAACIAERCRDLGNVRVICDDFTTFAADAEYDVVTLIGVLEYSRLFIRASDPVAECLSRARRLLRQGGVLIIAIENQLGLKYFNGCREDHLGVPFTGITDLYTADTAVTFGRAELDARLKSEGFERVDWYFPFPDYKTPTVVVAERALRTPGFSVSDLIFGEASRDYSGNLYRCFDEANVWPVLERNGLLPEFAHSLLAVALTGEDNGIDAEPERIAHKYAMRQARFATATTFIQRRQGKLEVEKRSLAPDAPQAGDRGTLAIVHRLGIEPYVRGTLFTRELSKALGRGHDLSYLAGLFTPWIKLLLERAEAPAGANAAHTPWSRLRLPGDMLDCVPFNLIVDDDGRLRPIDTEFAIEGTVPMAWVVLRGLVHTASKCFGQRAFFDLDAEALVREMLPNLGLADIDDWTPYLDLEDQLIRSVLLPWPGRPEHDIFRKRLALPVSAQLPYLEAFENSRASLERAQAAITRMAEFLQRVYAMPSVASTADADATTAWLTEVEHLSGEQIARLESTLDDRDRRWRTLLAEMEARFHQRERTLAQGMLDAEASVKAREAQLTAADAREEKLHATIAEAARRVQARDEAMVAAEAAERERERAMRESMVAAETTARERERAMRESMVAAETTARERERAIRESMATSDAAAQARERELGERLAANEAAARGREQQLHGALERLELELQRGRNESAARATAAAEREKILHETLARSEERAKVHEAQLAAHIASLDTRLAGKEEEAARTATQLRDAEEQLRRLSGQIEGLEQKLRRVEEYARKQTERAASAESRLEAIRASWPYRMVRRWIRADDPAQAQPVVMSRRGKLLFRATRAAYRMLPLSTEARLRLKNRFYGRYGRFFRNIQNYQLWHAQRRTIVRPPTTLPPVSERVSAHESPGRARAPARGVSVIIPAFGKPDMTRECIEAVFRSSCDAPVEIIVVDDGSPEPLAAALAGLDRVTVVRNANNLGFIASCNRGAALARETYLLLLNNDALVQPGALIEMLRTFASTPETGIVGCKLVFPDGRLQEAGARVKPDGSAEMIGLWDDPNRGCYNFAREVAYCSGACLMADRKLFLTLGGLDAAFAPAYCEDSDFCYRVRKAGRKVIYQPRATVVHRLSASMEDAGLDKHAIIAVNQVKFLERWRGTLLAEDAVRTIAFYLPQYHAIPENDEWWGKGFTEWTNVARARPVFPGHEQPIEPRELGYYDLRSSDVRQRQAELAKAHGIHGFCYYYYWFGGKRLLHEPFDQLIASGEPDFPFCVCWANENWTRRWDGLDSEILIAQKHSPQDDLHFIESLLPAFRDPRYIRIGDRPLLLVYRPSLLPDARATAARWRAYCRDHGIGDPYLVMAQSFYHLDSSGPDAFGFDAAVEFPPHSLAIEVPEQPRGINGQPFEGRVYDYAKTSESFLQREMPPYRLFRAVMPRWDNTPRRGSQAVIFAGATPAAFEHWLTGAVEYTKRMCFGDERLVFINAWNEWGEGNFLEPDLQFGRAFLEAVRDVTSR